MSARFCIVVGSIAVGLCSFIAGSVYTAATENWAWRFAIEIIIVVVNISLIDVNARNLVNATKSRRHNL